MTEIKFSIIIPVYNVEKYLPECLESALNQSFSDIEVICIDDCSTDGSKALLRSYAECDDRILIIEHQRNLGLGATRNTGLRQARGEYILFLDSDDYFADNIFGQVYRILKQNQLDVLQFNRLIKIDDQAGIDFYRGKNREIKERLNLTDSQVLNGPDFLLNTVKNRKFRLTVWSYAFRRQLLLDNQITFPEVRAHEDGPFVFQTLLLCTRVKMTDIAVYVYRRRENSLTVNPTFQYYLESINSCKNLNVFCLEPTLHPELRIWLQKLIRDRINNVLNKVITRKEWRKNLKIIVTRIKDYQLGDYVTENCWKRNLQRVLGNNFDLLILLIAFIILFKNKLKAPSWRSLIYFKGKDVRS